MNNDNILYSISFTADFSNKEDLSRLQNFINLSFSKNIGYGEIKKSNVNINVFISNTNSHNK